jgi:quinol monooxygenase YgiN
MGWELKEQLQNRVAISRKQPGCLNYDLYISQDDPSLFMLHENWTDQASLDQHFQTIEHDSWTKIRNKYVAERHVYFWRMAESKSSQ